MRKCQTISFSEDVLKIVEDYMQGNNVKFNKAVNELILKSNPCICIYKGKIQEIENKLNKVYSLFSVEALKENNIMDNNIVMDNDIIGLNAEELEDELDFFGED